MAKYFSKHIIDALQYLGNNIQDVILFTDNQAKKHPVYSCLILNEEVKIEIGDYVIKNEKGFVVKKPNHFENIYQILK